MLHIHNKNKCKKSSWIGGCKDKELKNEKQVWKRCKLSKKILKVQEILSLRPSTW